MASAAPALAELLQRSDLWRGGQVGHGTDRAVASGFAELDRILPGGGWPCGAITELLCREAGIGELSLLLPALTALDKEAGRIALVAPPWKVHAPAWQRAGITLERLLIVRAAGTDAAWACEQLLACEALGALVAWLPQADARTLRRLQLTVQSRTNLAFVFRPEAVAASASPAPLRLRLTAGEGALAVSVLKRRGPPLAEPVPLAVKRPLAWSRAAPRPPATLVRPPSVSPLESA